MTVVSKVINESGLPKIIKASFVLKQALIVKPDTISKATTVVSINASVKMGTVQLALIALNMTLWGALVVTLAIMELITGRLRPRISSIAFLIHAHAHKVAVHQKLKVVLTTELNSVRIVCLAIGLLFVVKLERVNPVQMDTSSTKSANAV